VSIGIQLHGHTFLIGWAGLMVLGVGLYFLPRLRGRPLAGTAVAHWILPLLLSGLVLRSIIQVWTAGGSPPDGLLPSGLALSAVLELLGATLSLALVARTFSGDPDISTRPRLVEILPFLVVAFGSLWLALALNLAAAVIGPTGGRLASVPHGLSLMIALYGFLVPISVGVGARLFPLHYAAPMPGINMLRAGLGLLGLGLAMRILGEISGTGWVRAIGLFAMAGGLAAFVIGTRVFAPRRVVPGGREAWYTDPAQWHGLVAFGCLGLNATVLAAAGLETLWPQRIHSPLHTEWHLIGVGFVTLLILGEGAKLLPGFAGRPLRSEALIWATLAFGTAALVMRVTPSLVPVMAGGLTRPFLIAASIAGMLAILAFAVNLSHAGDPRGSSRI
jgi:uncharacterized protein involved in response to NO